MRQFVLIHRQATLLEQAVQAYLGWNKLIRAQAPNLLVRVEDADRLLAPWLEARQLLPAGNRSPDLPPSNVNTRPHQRLTWEEIRAAVPRALFLEFQDLAQEYA